MDGLRNEYREGFKTELINSGLGPEGLGEFCQKWGITETEWSYLAGPIWRWSGVWESEGIRMNIMGGMGSYQFLFLNLEPND